MNVIIKELAYEVLFHKLSTEKVMKIKIVKRNIYSKSSKSLFKFLIKTNGMSKIVISKNKKNKSKIYLIKIDHVLS